MAFVSVKISGRFPEGVTEALAERRVNWTEKGSGLQTSDVVSVYCNILTFFKDYREPKAEYSFSLSI